MTKLITQTLLAAFIAFPVSVWAAPYVLSDVFSDDDPVILNIFDGGPDEALRYRMYGPITVDADGTYKVWDGRNAVTYFELFDETVLDNDVVLSVHDAPLDEADILGALVGVADDFDEIELEAGKEYYFVVQPFASVSGQKEFAVVLDGPGKFSGGGVMRLPGFYSGRFDDSDSLTNTIPEFVGCADSYYEVSGPYRVGQTGNYYMANYRGFEEGSINLVLNIYEDSFDPDNPYENQIANGPGVTQGYLRTGKDYYFVVQPDCDIVTGPYGYLVMPPADNFLWTPFAGGSFNDPTVPAQGALFDVLPEVGAVFMAWFTFANTEPGDGDDSDIGSAEQRWMVGFGNWEDPRDPVIDLTLFKTEGGMFNMPDDPANVPQTAVGTMRLDMTRRCEGGEGHYQLDSGPSGTVQFRRIAVDNVKNCINQNPRPAAWFDWRVN